MEFFIIIILVVLVILSLLLNLYFHKRNKELSHRIEYRHSLDVKSDYELLEEKELFLAKVSHQLSMPMNAIVGLSSIIMQGKLNKVQYNNVNKIKHFSEMISEILNDIMDISKMDAGHLKIDNIKFDINEVLEHVSNMVSLKTEEKGLGLVYNVDKSVPPLIVGDPLRLGQILINLIDNSIKFSDNGNIELNISTINDDFESKIGLEFRVIDHGVGMSKKQLSNLFKDFAHADESVARLYSGIGLGLSITKHLVNMMDGTIDVKSEEGVGTEFIVKIYFTKYEMNNHRNYRLPSKSLMSKNAIIVDSNRRSVESLSSMLKYFHYKVEVVSNLNWAKDLLSQVAYDMIFIDENSLLKSSERTIKDIKETYNVTIILIESIYYQNSNKMKNIKEIDKHISKPFNQETIYNMILEIYGHTDALKSKVKIEREDLGIYKNIHILIAEDNEISQKILINLLHDTGFKLIMTKKSDELMEKLSYDSEINLILIDVNMQSMDGYEVARNIREKPEYDDIPICALSSKANEEDIEEIFASGMQDYLTKPLVIDSLYEKLFNIFNERDEKIESKLKQERSSIHLKHYIYKDLDVNYGLDKCEHNNALYIALLDDFTKMYSDANIVFDSMIKDERYKDAEYFIHDLRGLASQIGGRKLSKSASNLEDMLLDKKFNKNSILVDRLKRDLKMLLIDIDRYKEDRK